MCTRFCWAVETGLRGCCATCRDSVERIEVLSLPLKEAPAFIADPSYPKSAGLLFGLMWLQTYIAAKKDLPADHVT